MAKLKQIALGAGNEDLVALIKSLKDKKFVGEAAAQALATAIAGKLNVSDVSYDEETGILKIKDIEINPMTAPTDGEDGQVLVYKTGEDGKPSTEWGDIKYDEESGKLTILDEEITPIQVPTSATAGQVLTFSGDESNPGVIWADLNLSDITESLTKFVTKASYVESYTSQTGDGTTGLTDAPAIVFYHDSSILCAISAQPFIKDGMVTGGVVTDGTGANENKKVLKLTLNTDAGVAPIEIPLDDLFKADNYFTKNEINNLLYGSNNGTFENATDTSLVGKLKAYVKFGTKANGQLDITIGGTTEKVLTPEALTTVTGDLDDITNDLYGEEGSSESPTDDSILGRLKAIENVDFVEITADDIAKMIAGTYGD